MAEYIHKKSTFFHKVSSDHQNDNFEAFSLLSILLIAARTNTNSCQAWILVNFTNVAPAHSSIQYRQICWYHLIEETHSYPHVWTFPENISKYLYGGLLISVNLLRRAVDNDKRTTCITFLALLSHTNLIKLTFIVHNTNWNYTISLVLKPV